MGAVLVGVVNTVFVDSVFSVDGALLVVSLVAAASVVAVASVSVVETLVVVESAAGSFDVVNTVLSVDDALLVVSLAAAASVVAVDSDSDETLLPRLLEHDDEFTLPPPNQGSENLYSIPLLQGQKLIHNLRGRLPDDRVTASGTVGCTGPSPKKPEVVIDLRDRANG